MRSEAMQQIVAETKIWVHKCPLLMPTGSLWQQEIYSRSLIAPRARLIPKTVVAAATSRTPAIKQPVRANQRVVKNDADA